MSWQEVFGLIGIATGIGGGIATVIFVVKDRTREQTIKSQGQLIETLGQEMEELQRQHTSNALKIKALEVETVKLRSEINGKDLLIVTALKQYFTDNPDQIPKVAKDFRQVLNIN